MAQTNDERILSLIELDGIKYNLHTITDWFPLIKLELIKIAAEELKIDLNEIVISGYPLTSWIQDVRNKMESEKYKTEKRKLDDLEKQLTSLLSDTKQTELKIDELESMLNL